MHHAPLQSPRLRQGGSAPPWALAPEDLPWPRLAAAAAAADSCAADCAAGSGGLGASGEVDWADLVPEYSGSLAPLLHGDAGKEQSR
jgi:hypothetical protein